MAFTIESNDTASALDQSRVYETDVAILVAGLDGVGVVSGCAVTAQGSPDMTVAVAAGTITPGPYAAVTAGNVTIGTADATNPRIDLISASAAGVKTITAGTAAAFPKPPALPAGNVALAYVYVPATDTTIGSNQITDKRVVLPVAPGTFLNGTTYSTGSDTAWASSTSTSTADIDATNASLAIVVPPSGKVYVLCEIDTGYLVANNGGYIVLRTGSTDLQAMAAISGAVASGGIGNNTFSASHMIAWFWVTGLTPGPLTLKLGLRRIGSTTFNVYANDGAGGAGHLASPFVMMAWAA